jgi:hypothetical protein
MNVRYTNCSRMIALDNDTKSMTVFCQSLLLDCADLTSGPSTAFRQTKHTI